MHYLLLFLIIIFSFSPVYSKDKDSLGTVRTKDFRYSLVTPKGWIADMQSGLEGGIPLIFLPKGKNWENSPVAFYSYVEPIDSAKPVILIINEDSRRMSMGIPKLSAKHLKMFALGNASVQVVHYISEEGKLFDAVAYIVQSPTLMVRYVFSAKTKEDFTKNLPLFEKSLQSYNFTAERE
ncbi:MAG TPA: hypothetical protein VEC36_06025 [Patescibacteria group bacterium]|nr:hypothetical protein [Patescibacteria group bacterium]